MCVYGWIDGRMDFLGFLIIKKKSHTNICIINNTKYNQTPPFKFFFFKYPNYMCACARTHTHAHTHARTHAHTHDKQS